MAHGNFSDLVFLALIGIVVQWWGCPETLFEDFGPMKAQFTRRTADMDALIKLGGGLLLMIGMTFSGVKWNPINGKMVGLGAFISLGYTIYSCFKADGEVFVPRPIYNYAFVLILGALHIFAFPSNPLPEKTPETKNNHGNSSDLVAFGLIGASLLCFVHPDHLFQDIGPLKAQFSEKTAELELMIKFVASLMLIVALMLSGVKWNPINGKMAGFGGFIAAGYTVYSTYKADKDVLVPRMFYIYAFFLFLGALHIFAFPSNPLVKKAEKKKD
eukprot:TRINITY_DN111203_c0_g1_i1.p1 TRINITY_DN111203_c0_g1~~TRINITY_DN111203_c0_g1_i1.p1  ORF type:complete len:302 (-),score=69.93 TRINITY_DN111203_c0_g1_i1:343-1158(-)